MENFEIPKRMDSILYKLSKLYKTKSDALFYKIIVNSSFSIIEQMVFDNWEGGTYGHRLILKLPETIYYEIIDKKEDYENKIKRDIEIFTNSINNEYLVDLIIESQNNDFTENWREESGISVERNLRIVQDNAINRIWSNSSNFRLFLSHKAEFKEEVSKLKINLNKFGICCFIAHEDIEPTQEWQNEIENALFSSDALLALMTDKFHESNWTDQEIGIAIGRGIPIISLKLGTVPYGFIGKYQALKINLETEYYEIASLLIKNHPKMIDIFVTQIEESNSWDKCNMLSKLLPSIQELNDQQVERLIRAYKTNVDVKGSFGFNGSKPREYGNGLKYELERITGKTYNL
ncbi:MAG: toll/interleukin-1 receptor domain-containing protein [Bacteroidetes bacterium]|nr:MAG: toll/interleukin-1 receptor domain-containing protein [Bacteroidota bacterium]